MELQILFSVRKDLAGQIYRQVRDAILAGHLRGGERLAPTRLLAEQIGVSRTTVTEAYDRLMAEGFLDGRVGAGSFVAALPPSDRPTPRRAAPASRLAIRAVWGTSLPMEASTAPDMPGPRGPSFRVGLPDSDFFPHDEWRRLAGRWLRRHTGTSGRYDAAAGRPDLRDAIARFVALSRSVDCTADDVLVTNGAQQAIDLVGRVLIETGMKVAVEDPGYPPARAILRTHGADLVGVPVDAEGIVVARLPEDARLVYVTPSHQFPLGVAMSLGRRLELLRWAAARNAAIIEDDYDSEFRYAGQPLEPLQSLDRGGHVVYVGTFSKVISPELRLGFAVAREPLRSAMLRAKRLSDWHTEPLSQATLASFMATSGLARHIRKMRRLYDARRRRLLSLLERDFAGELAPIPSFAGLHLAARLPPHADDRLLAERAAALGLKVGALSPYYWRRPGRPGLVFGYGAIREDEIAPALKLLRSAMRDCPPVSVSQRRRRDARRA